MQSCWERGAGDGSGSMLSLTARLLPSAGRDLQPLREPRAVLQGSLSWKTLMADTCSHAASGPSLWA